jgi:DNA-binding NarL/FixJ family response regulator
MDVSTPVTAILVDDHEVVRAGLRLVVESLANLTVIGEARSVAEAAAMDLQADPDLVLTDLTMPDLDDGEALEVLRRRFPDAKILVLSTVDDPSLVRGALDAGASGFLSKRAAPEELPVAVAHVLSGRRYVSVGDDDREGADRGATPSLEGLTSRELEVGALLVRGHTNAEVAQLLSISTRTVESHRASIYRKLRVRTRAELFQVWTGASPAPDRASGD